MFSLFWNLPEGSFEAAGARSQSKIDRCAHIATVIQPRCWRSWVSRHSSDSRLGVKRASRGRNSGRPRPRLPETGFTSAQLAREVEEGEIGVGVVAGSAYRGEEALVALQQRRCEQDAVFSQSARAGQVQQREQHADLVRAGAASADIDVQAAEFVLVEGEGHDHKLDCKSSATDAAAMTLAWTQQ